MSIVLIYYSHLIEFLVFGCSFEGKAVVTNDTSTFFVRAERLPDPQLPTTYTPTYTPLRAPSPSPQVLGAGTPSTQRLAKKKQLRKKKYTLSSSRTRGYIF